MIMGLIFKNVGHPVLETRYPEGWGLEIALEAVKWFKAENNLLDVARAWKLSNSFCLTQPRPAASTWQ